MELEDDKGMRLPGMVGYPASKLLNVMHARELAKRLKGNHQFHFLFLRAHLHLATATRLRCRCDIAPEWLTK